MPTFDRTEMQRACDADDLEFQQEVDDNLELALSEEHPLSAGRYYGKASANYARITDRQLADKIYAQLRCAWDVLKAKHGME